MTVLTCWDFSFLVDAAAFAGLGLGIRTRALLPRSGLGESRRTLWSSVLMPLCESLERAGILAQHDTMAQIWQQPTSPSSPADPVLRDWQVLVLIITVVRSLWCSSGPKPELANLECQSYSRFIFFFNIQEKKKERKTIRESNLGLGSEKGFKKANSHNHALSFLKMRPVLHVTNPSDLDPVGGQAPHILSYSNLLCVWETGPSIGWEWGEAVPVTTGFTIQNPRPFRRFQNILKITYKVLCAGEGSEPLGRILGEILEPNRSHRRISFASPASWAVNSTFFHVFERSEGFFFSKFPVHLLNLSATAGKQQLFVAEGNNL